MTLTDEFSSPVERSHVSLDVVLLAPGFAPNVRDAIAIDVIFTHLQRLRAMAAARGRRVARGDGRREAGS